MSKKLNDLAKNIFPIYGAASYVAEKAKESSYISQQVLATGDNIKIAVELNRKKAEAKILEYEAKIAQELAIAERIKNAVNVEIEEYYETSSDGKAGFSVTEDKGSLDFSGSDTKITKRVYKFIGNTGVGSEILKNLE